MVKLLLKSCQAQSQPLACRAARASQRALTTARQLKSSENSDTATPSARSGFTIKKTMSNRQARKQSEAANAAIQSIARQSKIIRAYTEPIPSFTPRPQSTNASPASRAAVPSQVRTSPNSISSSAASAANASQPSRSSSLDDTRSTKPLSRSPSHAAGPDDQLRLLGIDTDEDGFADRSYGDGNEEGDVFYTPTAISTSSANGEGGSVIDPAEQMTEEDLRVQARRETVRRTGVLAATAALHSTDGAGVAAARNAQLDRLERQQQAATSVKGGDGPGIIERPRRKRAVEASAEAAKALGERQRGVLADVGRYASGNGSYSHRKAAELMSHVEKAMVAQAEYETARAART